MTEDEAWREWQAKLTETRQARESEVRDARAAIEAGMLRADVAAALGRSTEWLRRHVPEVGRERSRRRRPVVH